MKITIYTITDCQFSKQEKEYLASHNLPFEERNLETNHEYLTEMLNVSNNFAGTPVTKLEKEDGTVVVMKGFTAEEFDKELGFKKEEEKAKDTQSDSSTKSDQSVKSNQLAQSDKLPQSDQSQTMAPPTTPPEMPVPQPPSPVPQPPTPQPPTPETPVVPPIIPDQNAQPMNDPLPPLALNDQPSISAASPQSPSSAQSPSSPEADSTIDDASLDAILNQLQEKTAEQKKPDQPQAPGTNPPPAGSPPNVPEFGSSS